MFVKYALTVVALGAATTLAFNDIAPGDNSQYFNLPGSVVGYSSSMNGMMGIQCQSSYTCILNSFQVYGNLPLYQPTVYGERIIYNMRDTYAPVYGDYIFEEFSPRLINVTKRVVNFNRDCGVPVTLSSSSYAYGTYIAPPRALFNSANDTLMPPSKTMQLQVVAFNNSANYSEINETYFRIFDLDLSEEGKCNANDLSPDLETQRKMKLGTGYMRCAVRKDEIDNNATGVVKSTHYVLVSHDYSSGVCHGTTASGGVQSCLRMVRMTSYSNGTLGTVKKFDITSFPQGNDLASSGYSVQSQSCYLDEASGRIAMLGVTYSTGMKTLITMSNLDSSYSPPVATLVRTFPSAVSQYLVYTTVMNMEGYFGFISGSSLLTYTLDGDLAQNNTLPIGGRYNALTMSQYMHDIQSVL